MRADRHSVVAPYIAGLTMRENPRIYARTMDLHQTLLRCVDAYCEARGLARATVSGLILKDSRAFDRVAAGGNVTIRNFDRAMRWLSANWPENTPWPEGIKRPEPIEAAD